MEFDWMGFLWNLNTSTANKFVMADIYATYKGTNTTAPAWIDLQTAAETSLGPTSVKVLYFKSTGAQFGVDTNTAP